MKFALINPFWTYDRSIYFGCREPHLPLEYGYAKALLEERGHDVLLLNAHADRLDEEEILTAVEQFRTDIAVITTGNSYLLWRCAQPELKIPMLLAEDLRQVTNFIIAVGPHASSTPRATLNKLKVDAAVLGEYEEVLPLFADTLNDLQFVPSIAYRGPENDVRIQGVPHSTNMVLLPALKWSNAQISNHAHQHHRFNAARSGPGAEMEVSRGCPYHCTFCAKDNFRNEYRKRPHDKILIELDALLNQGVEYVYFIDEIFLPDKRLLESFAERKFYFGIQTRIDLWSQELIDLLGTAGCVSIEAGVESIIEEGQAPLDKKCRLGTDQLTQKLVYARQNIPFVQANLLESRMDDRGAVEEWRNNLIERGVWANEPVPLFPYPGSPEYTRLWGVPDDYAWERAQNYYLKLFDQFSDIQDQRPVPLQEHR